MLSEDQVYSMFNSSCRIFCQTSGVAQEKSLAELQVLAKVLELSDQEVDDTVVKYSNMYRNSINSSTYVNCTAELDDRFDFDFDEIGNEIYIDARVEYAPIYLEDEQIIGNGAGMQYDIIVAIPRDKDYWQMKEKILRSLDEHVKNVVDGSDYYGCVVTVDSHTHPHYANIPDDVYDDSVFYSATIEIVPYQNMDAYGEYGVDFGVEDYE